MRKTAFPFVIATLVAPLVTGCNDPSSAGMDMGGGNPDLIPLVCNGSFSNAVNGTFRPCGIDVALTANDESLHIVPKGYTPLPGQPSPAKVLFDLVATPVWKVQKYTLNDSFGDGTQMLIQNSANQANFIAGRTVDENTQQRTIVGKIELTLTSLPKAPPGMDAWTDTDVHGSLTANLPLDPNSPGTPGDSVNVTIDF